MDNLATANRLIKKKGHRQLSPPPPPPQDAPNLHIDDPHCPKQVGIFLFLLVT